MVFIMKLWSSKQDLLLAYSLVLTFNSLFSQVSTELTATLPNYPDYYENDIITLECSPEQKTFQQPGTVRIQHSDAEFVNCGPDRLSNNVFMVTATEFFSVGHPEGMCGDFELNYLFSVEFIANNTPNLNYTCRMWDSQNALQYTASWVSPHQIKLPPTSTTFSLTTQEYYEGESITISFNVAGGKPATKTVVVNITAADGVGSLYETKLSNRQNNVTLVAADRKYDGAIITAASEEHLTYLTKKNKIARLAPLIVYYIYLGHGGTTRAISKKLNIEYEREILTCKPENFNTTITNLTFQWARDGEIDPSTDERIMLTQKDGTVYEDISCKITATKNPDYFRHVIYNVEWKQLQTTQLPSAANSSATRFLPVGNKRISTGGAVGIATAVLFCLICVVIIVMWARSSKNPSKIPSIDPSTNDPDQKKNDPGVERSVEPIVKTQSILLQPSAHGGSFAGVDELPLSKPVSELSSQLPLKRNSVETRTISWHNKIKELNQPNSKSTHYSKPSQQATHQFSNTPSRSKSRKKTKHATKSKNSSKNLKE